MIVGLVPRSLAAAALLWAAPIGAQTPAAAQPTAVAAARPPVEAFAQLPFLTDAQLSPDGTRVAGRLNQDGNEYIAIWTLGAAAGQRPRLLPSTNVAAFQWANDDRILMRATSFYVVRALDYIYQIPASNIVSIDLSTNRFTPIGPARNYTQDVLFVDPDGRYVLLSTFVPGTQGLRVVRVDLATGATTEAQPVVRGVWNWFADSQGIVRLGVDYGQRRIRTYYRADAQSPLRLIANARNEEDDSVIDSVRFANNGSQGVIVTNAETGRFAVYDYDFATNTRGRLLFGRPDVDIGTVIFDRDGSVDGVAFEEDRPRVHWLDPAMASLQARIDRAFPDHSNTIVNQSRDGNRILLLSSAADDPGTYYVYDQNARRMETFASPYDRLIGGRFAPVQAVTYRSRDGLMIPAYLTLPPGRRERDLPLIVLPHGGPFARDSWGFDPEVQFLASRGYAVLQPNFRGSTGYGRAYVERGYGQFGSGMIDDIEDGVDWLRDRGTIDPARVCIMGSSYGGYAALWASMRNPQRYRCAISFAGVSDIRAILRHSSTFFTARRYSREWRRMVRGDESADLAAISPLQQAGRARVPMLIAHGERDRIVPPDQSRRLVRALERVQANVESVFYVKSAHGFTDEAEATDYLQRVEAFLNRHNPANAASAAAPLPAQAD